MFKMHEMGDRALGELIDAGQNVLRGATGGTRSEAQFELSETNFAIGQLKNKISQLRRNSKYQRERVSREIDAANKLLQERELSRETQGD